MTLSKTAKVVQSIEAKRIQAFTNASFAGETQAITDPENEIPALLRIAGLSARIRASQLELRRNGMRHADFGARHAGDDDGHESFRQTRESLTNALVTFNKQLDLEIEQLGAAFDLTKIEVTQ